MWIQLPSAPFAVGEQTKGCRYISFVDSPAPRRGAYEGVYSMKTMCVILACLGFSVCALNGCASLVFDRYDTVDIMTAPEGVEIYDSQGFNVGITPVQIALKRFPGQEFTLRKDGYSDSTIAISTSINPWSTLIYFMYYLEHRNISPGPGIYGKFLIAQVLLTPIADSLLGGIFKKNDKPYAVHMKKTDIIPTLTDNEDSKTCY